MNMASTWEKIKESAEKFVEQLYAAVATVVRGSLDVQRYHLMKTELERTENALKYVKKTVNKKRLEKRRSYLVNEIQKLEAKYRI
jgi:phosphoglycerate-specific signal transduction histidine kinase